MVSSPRCRSTGQPACSGDPLSTWCSVPPRDNGRVRANSPRYRNLINRKRLVLVIVCRMSLSNVFHVCACVLTCMSLSFFLGVAFQECALFLDSRSLSLQHMCRSVLRRSLRSLGHIKMIKDLPCASSEKLFINYGVRAWSSAES